MKLLHDSASVNLSSTIEQKKLARVQADDTNKKTPRMLLPKRERTSGFHRMDVVDDDLDGPLNILDAGVNLCARRYNECKALAMKLEVELNRKLDELEGLKKETDQLQNMIGGHHVEAKEIAKLRHSIDCANSSSESDLRYRRQLEHMTQRQQQRASHMMDQTSKLSEELGILNSERQKCQQSCNEVELALIDANRSFNMTKAKIDLELADRQRLLDGRKSDADNMKIMDKWRRTQEMNNNEFDHAIIHSFQTEKEAKVNKIREKEAEIKALSRTVDTECCGKEISDEVMIFMKSATGIKNIDEMVDKILNHRAKSSKLHDEKVEVENRLRCAKESFLSYYDAFQGMKSDTSDKYIDRDAISKIGSKISTEKGKGKLIKSTSERLEGVIIGLRQGTTGLYQRLLSFHSTLLEGNAPIVRADADAMQAARDTLEMLKVAERILGKMLDTVGGIKSINSKSQYFFGRDKQSDSVNDQESTDLGNCRIQPKNKPLDACEVATTGDDSSTCSSDTDGDILSRRSVKNLSEKHFQRVKVS